MATTTEASLAVPAEADGLEFARNVLSVEAGVLDRVDDLVLAIGRLGRAKARRQSSGANGRVGRSLVSDALGHALDERVGRSRRRRTVDDGVAHAGQWSTSLTLATTQSRPSPNGSKTCRTERTA